MEQQRKTRNRKKRAMVTLLDPSASIPSYVDIHAEDAVIGALLINSERYGDIAHKIVGRDFYQPLCAWVYAAIEQLIKLEKPIDLVTVAAELSRMAVAYPDKFKIPVETILPSLSRLMSATPSSEHITAYAQQVYDSAQRGRLCSAAKETIKAATNKAIPVGAAIDAALIAMQKAALHADNAGNDISSIVAGYEPGKVHPQVPVGFTDFDKEHGFDRDTVSIWSGTSGKGKSTSMLSIAASALSKKDAHVEWFSFELSKSEIVQHLIAMESGIWRSRLSSGDLVGCERDYSEAAQRVASWKLRIYDDTDMEAKLAAVNRHLYVSSVTNSIDLIVIDGLWLMEPDEPTEGKAMFCWPKIIKDATTQIAKRFNAAVVFVHQFNGDGYEAGDKPPPHTTQYGGSAIVHSADNIFCMIRQESTIKIYQTKRRGKTDNPIPMTWYYNQRHACYQEAMPAPGDNNDLAF